MLEAEDKKHLKNALLLVLILLAAFLLFKSIAEYKSLRFIGGGVPSSNVITVSGEGEIFAAPDLATFSFSVIKEEKTADGAQESAAELVNSALEMLRDNGVEEKDIKTANYNVYPRYEYTRSVCNEFNCPPGKRELRGFEVNQSVSVKIRDTEKAGEIISKLGSLGIENISGLSFTIDDEDDLKREARKEAIDDARDKAQELAKDLGVSLIRIVNFSESGGGGIYRTYGAVEKFADAAFEEGAPAIAPEIPVGENTIRSNISITYEIR